MTHRATIGLVFFITALALVNLLYASSAWAAGSTITITSNPYLSFLNIPDSLTLGAAPYTVPVTNLSLVSDENGLLPSSRSLTLQDTREDGGFLLQLDASEFLPTPATDLRNGLRIVTSPASTLYSDIVPVNGVKYLPADGETAFIGNQTVNAPLTATGTAFSDTTTFTAVSGNVLNTTVDILDGCLTSGGRKGKMNVHVSYNMDVPKYTVPPATGDQYYSTLTYTLSDYTPESCP